MGSGKASGRLRGGATLSTVRVMRTLLLALSGLTCLCRAAIVERAVEYQAGDVTCEGWQAYDDTGAGQRPAVLVIHQWTGISPHEKAAARRLAELGYNVLVADIYGKGVRPQPPEAGKVAGSYKADRALLRSRARAALDVLAKDARTAPGQLAAVGYCFGGTAALELARSGAALKAVVTFHGGLDSPAPGDGRNIRARVLALHGADDPFVPAKDVDAFEREMQVAKVDYRLIKYPGAVHSFTHIEAGDDNSRGAAYNADADKASWSEMQAWLKSAFSR